MYLAFNTRPSKLVCKCVIGTDRDALVEMALHCMQDSYVILMDLIIQSSKTEPIRRTQQCEVQLYQQQALRFVESNEDTDLMTA